MNWFLRLLGIGSGTSGSEKNSTDKNVAVTEAAMAELKARFESLYRPAIHLRPGASGGFSRLGGLPVMPADWEWPEWNSKPQSFLAQLDLSEIHQVMPSFLPSSGYLYFFYDQDQGVWGFDPNDIGGWRVLYVQGDRHTFVERAAPKGLDDDYIYPVKWVAPQRIELLPETPTDTESDWDWDRDGEAYDELRRAAFEGETYHQMLGYPSPVQNADMEKECQLASNGVYVGTAEGYKDP